MKVTNRFTDSSRDTKLIYRKRGCLFETASFFIALTWSFYNLQTQIQYPGGMSNRPCGDEIHPGPGNIPNRL